MSVDERSLLERFSKVRGDLEAGHVLASIYEDGARWSDLVEHLLECIDRGYPRRAELYDRVAQIYEKELGRPETAWLVLLDAFAETRDDSRFGEALGRLAVKTDRFERLVEVYSTALGDATTREAVPLHRRLAEWSGRLGQEDASVRHLRRVLVLKPDDQAAFDALCFHYEKRDEWEALAQMLRTHLNYVDGDTERQALFHRVSAILEGKLGRPTEALELMGRLLHESPSPELTLELERLAGLDGDWQSLLILYSQVLDDAPPQDRPIIEQAVARVYLDRMGDPPAAIRYLRRALEARPKDLLLHRQLRTVLIKESRWLDLAHHIGHEAEHAPSAHERALLYLEQGEIFRDRVEAPNQAVEAWFRALELQPNNKPILVRLMDAYRSTGQWDASVKVLRKLASVEDVPSKRAQYMYAMAVIERDKFEDDDRALDSLDYALDLDPRFEKAYAALDALLQEGGDATRQDYYFRRMLARAIDAGLTDDRVIDLALRIGHLNRDILGDDQAAYDAYRLALQRRPDDLTLRKRVAELATVVGQLEAAARHQTFVYQQDPTNPEPLHELLRIFCADNRLDSAWCISQALVMGEHATPEEQEFYTVGANRSHGVKVGSMTAGDWRLLEAGEGHSVLVDLLGRLESLMTPRMNLKRRQLGLRGKDQVTEGTSAFSLVRYVSHIMGVPLPPIWRTKRIQGAQSGRLDGPIMLIGPDFESLSARAQAFLTARTLFTLRGPQRLVSLSPTAEGRAGVLRNWLQTTHQWMDPEYALDTPDRHLANRLAALPTDTKLDLWSLMGELVGREGYGLNTWLRDLELTAGRLGLLIANDLQATRTLTEGLIPFGPVNVATRIEAVTLFSVSESYFRLRQRLGYAIANTQQS